MSPTGFPEFSCQCKNTTIIRRIKHQLLKLYSSSYTKVSYASIKIQMTLT